MSIEKWILWICIYYVSVERATLQFTESRLCEICLCMDTENVIICNENDKIGGLPTNIDMKYEKLTIQNGYFQDPVLYRHNLTGLSHLNYLKVIYCRLKAVEMRAFENMKNLKYLDLSHNILKIIQPFTFSGLNLNELHLMENSGLTLSIDSFSEMNAATINLRSNDIKSIQYNVFAKTNFKKLHLYQNRITVIDQRFSEIFARTNSIIDLTGNPLDCSCEMRWMLPLLKEKFNNPQYAKYMKTINFTCATPSKLLGREMKSLSTLDMPCPSAKITTIIVALGIPLTELTCVAMGNNYRAPGVSWNYVEPESARELRRTPLTKSSNTTENLQTSLSVKVKITSKWQAFTCKSWLEENQSENIVVNIKSPLQYDPRTTVVTTNVSYRIESGSKDLFRPIPEPHFIFKKQFTILEMIGAVVGTFTITLILLAMLAQLLRWWRRGQKPEPNYKSVNIIKPYWTMGHDSNNTYSHPVSHTEYDIPRTYDTDAPSMCQSPPLSRGEFLDYKTQNKIYST